MENQSLRQTLERNIFANDQARTNIETFANKWIGLYFCQDDAENDPLNFNFTNKLIKFYENTYQRREYNLNQLEIVVVYKEIPQTIDPRWYKYHYERENEFDDICETYNVNETPYLLIYNVQNDTRNSENATQIIEDFVATIESGSEKISLLEKLLT